MSFVLRVVKEDLTSPGTTSTVVTLTGNPPGGQAGTFDAFVTGLLRNSYTESQPEIDITSQRFPQTDGASISGFTYRNVVGSARIRINGTGAQIGQTISEIERIVTALKGRPVSNNKVGERYFLELRPEGSLSFTRSPLLALRTDFEANTLYRWAKPGTLIIQVFWERAYWWEATSETEAPLSNVDSTNVTGGMTVVNQSDYTPTTTSNWVAMLGSVIHGDVPSPIRLEIENTTPGVVSTEQTTTIFIGQNIFSTRTTVVATAFPHILEAEDAAAASPAITKVTIVDGNASNGNRATFEWTDATGGEETELAVWSLDDDFLSRAKGQRFKILGVFGANPAALDSGIQVRLRLKSGVSTLYSTRWLSLIEGFVGTLLQELGNLDLAPYEVGGTYRGIDLVLVAKHPTSGTYTFDLDFVQATPTDRYRFLRSPIVGLDLNEILYDDMMWPRLYQEDTSNQGVNYWNARGNALVAYPQRTTILYFLQRDGIGAPTGDRTLRIKVYYRQRSLFPYMRQST